MLSALATTAPGLEGVLRRSSLAAGAGVPPAHLAMPGLVPLEVAGPEALVELLSELASAHRMGPLLGTGRLDPEDPWRAVAGLVDALALDGWLDAEVPFAVRCTRRGEHPFTSLDVEREVGGALHDRLGREHAGEPTVDLEEPGAVVRVHLDPACRVAVWLDLVGYQELHRRGWRTYQHRAGMKPTLAAGLLDLMGHGPGQVVLDPLCGSATLGIEAAWRAHGVPPTRLRRDTFLAWNAPVLREADRDRLMPATPLPDEEDEAPDAATIHLSDIHPPHIPGAQENARAAGVASCLQIEQASVDTVAERGIEPDLIVANPPYGLRSSSPREAARVLDVLLAGAGEVLPAAGRVGLMTPQLDLVEGLAAKHGFELARAPEVQHGKLAIRLIVLEPA